MYTETEIYRGRNEVTAGHVISGDFRSILWMLVLVEGISDSIIKAVSQTDKQTNSILNFHIFYWLIVEPVICDILGYSGGTQLFDFAHD